MQKKEMRALITGITGQDGSYLAELLLTKKYQVHGLVRRSSSFNRARLEHLFHEDEAKKPALFLHYGDMTDAGVLMKLIHQIEPDEIYNLAAQSHVAVSFEIPEYTTAVDALGTLSLLEAVRRSEHNQKNNTRVPGGQFRNVWKCQRAPTN